MDNIGRPDQLKYFERLITPEMVEILETKLRTGTLRACSERGLEKQEDRIPELIKERLTLYNVPLHKLGSRPKLLLTLNTGSVCARLIKENLRSLYVLVKSHNESAVYILCEYHKIDGFRYFR